MRAELQTLHAAIETVTNARRSWSSRASVRLILDDGAGHVGLGEAAPLPGLSRETIPQARGALAKVVWPETPPETVEDALAIVERIDARFPSARFAAETALFALIASVREEPMWALFTDARPAPLPIAGALWAEDPDAMRAAAQEASAQGIAVVKIKVGRPDRERERALLDAARETLPEAELRLDANGAFRKKELPERFEELARYRPSLLEEPCALRSLLTLKDVPFPLAVDESLSKDTDARLARVLRCDAIGVVVLKPSLVGGLSRTLELARRAQAGGRDVVVSHLLEGAIARCAAAHVALVIGGRAAGLGDHPGLALLSDGFGASWIDGAWIEPPELPGLGLELRW